MTLVDDRLNVPRPRRIRRRYQARSIRAGILVARGLEVTPGGWIDWRLFEEAHLRTHVSEGQIRRRGLGGRL